MPIFGQVWLWSLAAFLLGAILTWVLVVLPVRRRMDALESRLSAIRADVKLSAAAERSRSVADPSPAAPGLVPGFGDVDGRDEIRADTLTRAYALPGVQNVPSTPYGEPAGDEAVERGALSLSEDAAPGGATEYLSTAGRSESGRDWFDEQPAGADRRLIDDEDHGDDQDDDRGTVFTQRTRPIPGALIRQLDDSVPDEPAPRPEDNLVDDLADAADEPPAPVTTVLTPPDEPSEPEPETARPPVFEPIVVGPNGSGSKPVADAPADRPDEERVPAGHRATVAELTGLAESAVGSGLTVEPERAPSALPKRIPAKPQHRHPFGVQTVTPAVSLSNTGSGSERMRSLFEPIVPAEGGQTAVPPPPHRLQQATATATSTGSRPSAPGPFGPGSAMPLPGGASPSPEFTVKASVTALRYCTPESPQFGRTVAEVWFRTAADAERVGFRPVG